MTSPAQAQGRPMWRSMLFVPVIVEKFVDAAHRRGADAIILDLEDSVPESQKERARGLIQDAAAKVSQGGADVTVRINRPWRQALRDLEAAVSPRVRALLCPKIDSADHVRLISEVVADLEAERDMVIGSTLLVPMIETADAFFRIHDIARADPRIVAINLGAEDFALSVGMLPEPEGLFYPKQHLIIAARAAGIMPLGFIGTVAEFKDLDAFRLTVQRSRRLGFMGASVIHPSQIQILNEEFRPTAEEVAQARKIVAAYEKSTAEGVGAIVVDGKMIDVPIVVRAQQALAREAAIAARDPR
ncbi:MAG: CoA ester lyase [Proteobacteria bacterium]|nr:CoA ester lyase [Pseudomonadota bacterium]